MQLGLFTSKSDLVQNCSHVLMLKYAFIYISSGAMTYCCSLVEICFVGVAGD